MRHPARKYMSSATWALRSYRLRSLLATVLSREESKISCTSGKQTIKQSFTSNVKLKNHNVSFTHFVVSCYLSVFQKWSILFLRKIFWPALGAPRSSGPRFIEPSEPPVSSFLRHWPEPLVRGAWSPISWSWKHLQKCKVRRKFIHYSESELTFTFAMLSPVRLSSACRLIVCLHWHRSKGVAYGVGTDVDSTA